MTKAIGQAALLYTAERDVDRGQLFASLEACQAYVDAVTGSDWWRYVCPSVPEVRVLSKRGTRVATSNVRDAAINLPQWAWNERVILHELAHQIEDARHGGMGNGHGGYYAYWFLALVKQFMGAHRSAELLHAFEKQGVYVELKAPDENRGRRKLAPVADPVGQVWLQRTWQDITRTHVLRRQVHKLVQSKGLSVSSLVRAFGGDRGRNAPMAPYWQQTFVNGRCWLPRECLEHLDELSPATKLSHVCTAGTRQDLADGQAVGTSRWHRSCEGCGCACHRPEKSS